jgi:hypothetical protein
MSAAVATKLHRPILVVIRGKVGSGKSTVARGIERRLGFVRVDYDAEMLKAYLRYASPVESVRDLSRQEGRIAAGKLARTHLDGGHSVVCDADLRDSHELSELTSYNTESPGQSRALLLRLEISHDEALMRKITPDWNEYRRDPRAASQYFQQLWSYPFLRIEGEHTLNVDGKSSDDVDEEACELIGPPD